MQTFLPAAVLGRNNLVPGILKEGSVPKVKSGEGDSLVLAHYVEQNLHTFTFFTQHVYLQFHASLAAVEKIKVQLLKI